MDDLLSQVLSQAGPRGATFAGRYIPQGSKPSLKQLLTRVPTSEMETAGQVDPAALASLASLYHITTLKDLPQVLKEGLKPKHSSEYVFLTDKAGVPAVKNWRTAAGEK